MGLWRLWRIRNWQVLLLCVVPFGLTFVAALLQLYPYGGSARVAQHLAPAICSMAAVGAATLAGRWGGSGSRRKVLVAWIVLVGVGIGGMSRDILKPYKTEADERLRHVVDQINLRNGVEDQIVILNRDPGPVPSAFEWYLRRGAARIAWGGEIDWERLKGTTQHLWVLSFNQDLPALDQLEAQLARGADRPVLLADRATHWFPSTKGREDGHRAEIVHWIIR